jgi:hypothetical protein
MINKLMLNIVYTIALLSLAGSATACNHGTDPIKNSTDYDAAKKAMDDCNYKGGFYLAELVANQRTDSPTTESMSQRPAQVYSKDNDNDSENHGWLPARWSDLY